MHRKRKPTESAVSVAPPPEGTSSNWLKMIAIDKSDDPGPERGGRSRARRLSEASVRRAFPMSSNPPSQTAEADLSQILFYNSKDRVRKNDLVIRIRDPESMEGGENKEDRLDIYNGPFRISRLLRFSGLSNPRKKTETDNVSSKTSAPLSEVIDAEQMREALVKLYFPINSKGKALTKLGRLRPVYEIPQNGPANSDARSCYHLAETEGHARKVLNTLVLDKESDGDEASTDVRGVCRIQKGAYVKVDYAAHEGPVEDELFEVEKLRGKRVNRHSLAEYPDEKINDPIILRYLERGGYLDKSEVLVVKYLVHWAGWPSEDDTWERAQGNIPQEFIDRYNASMPNPDVVIPDRPYKRRKSESLGAKPFVKGS
ncbi:hypothetical protein MMC34_002758 [Xylographa carneopallida]|nr:hypothetical protein [Xylographa carneopallida]